MLLEPGSVVECIVLSVDLLSMRVTIVDAPDADATLDVLVPSPRARVPQPKVGSRVTAVVCSIHPITGVRLSYKPEDLERALATGEPPPLYPEAVPHIPRERLRAKPSR